MVLNNGFRKKQFNDIKHEIEQSLTASLGSVNLIAPSIFASIVGIFAEREASLWEQLEAVYNSAYPDTAEGYSLDGVCALSGVIREVATYSETICQLTAILYSKIPKHSEIAVRHTNNLFALTEDVIISNERCSKIRVQIKDDFRITYELSINGIVFKYDKKSSDTIDSIAGALEALVNDSNEAVSALAANDHIILSANNHLEEFSCFVTAGIKIVDCTNNAQVRATKKGAIAAPSLSLSDIHTPVSGWVSSSNINAAKIGNNLESDRNLRERRNTSIKLGGSGTFESMRANLLNLPGVTAVTITENTSNIINEEGLPAHSFKALVTGGKNSEIARAVWQKKPAGIRSHGSLQVSTNDSAGNIQIVSFSRPTKCFVHIKIVITKTRCFNEGCIFTMKEKLTRQINKLGVGTDVIVKSLFLSVFIEQGITNATIELGGTTRETYLPKLKESDIKIKASEVALIDPSRIEIILEDFKE